MLACFPSSSPTALFVVVLDTLCVLSVAVSLSRLCALSSLLSLGNDQFGVNERVFFVSRLPSLSKFIRQIMLPVDRCVFIMFVENTFGVFCVLARDRAFFCSSSPGRALLKRVNYLVPNHTRQLSHCYCP